jgi:uncharacterized membrane protein
MANPGLPPDDETERERLDRELTQLLNEMRLAMPGVQVLFAFLLAVPFAQGFQQVDSFDRNVYLFSLVCAALASAFMIAPTAYHRIMFRQGDKAVLIRLASFTTVVGLVLLMLSMNAAIYLVTDAVFDFTSAVIVTASSTLIFLVLWFGIASVRRAQHELDERREKTG